MRRTAQRLCVVWVGTLLSSSAAAAELPDPIPEPITKGSVVIELQTVASGLVAPNYLTHAGDGTGRLFVVDQIGTIRIIEGGVLVPTPFLDISFANPDPIEGRLVEPRTNFDERGLLGLAFHPDFTDDTKAGYRKVYTYSSEPVSGPADFTVPLNGDGSFNHQSVVTEWQVDAANPNRIDPATRREIMRIDQPQFNHNAGMIAFGPDRELYIALGDGGQGDDQGAGHGPDGNGQNKGNVLGTILRIDADGQNSANGQYGVPDDNPFVDDPTGVDEIYAYGLRNPFRFSFDVDPATGQVTGDTTGELIVADVGQNDIEEVDVVTAGGNFGWRVKEGSFAFDPNGGGDGFVTDDVVGGDFLDPVLEYDHDEGISVIGGFVYRGSAIPALQGKYVFGDFVPADGRLFYGDLDTGLIHELIIGPDDRDLGLFVKGFGRDADGELYVLAGTNVGPVDGDGNVLTGGLVLKIVPEPTSLALLAAGLLAMVAFTWRRSRKRS